MNNIVERECSLIKHDRLIKPNINKFNLVNSLPAGWDFPPHPAPHSHITLSFQVFCNEGSDMDVAHGSLEQDRKQGSEMLDLDLIRTNIPR